jgi:uncharacterized protein
MAIITQLWYYPVKSLAGIQLQKGWCGPKGLAYDRRWMLVDAEGQFMTQRKHAKMALLQPKLSFENGQPVSMIIDDLTNMEPRLEIGLDELFGEKLLPVQVWDDSLECYSLSERVNSWFSKVLRHNCSLVFQRDENNRKVDPKYAQKFTDETSLSDGYPYLLLGEEALHQLNSKLESPVNILRFRPNIVFSGEIPHFEDVLGEVQIGEARFVGVKPCARCPVVDIDPSTAVSGKTVLKELSKYRLKNNKVYFGQNLVISTIGTIAVGDIIQWTSV